CPRQGETSSNQESEHLPSKVRDGSWLLAGCFRQFLDNRESGGFSPHPQQHGHRVVDACVDSYSRMAFGSPQPQLRGANALCDTTVVLSMCEARPRAQFVAALN